MLVNSFQHANTKNTNYCQWQQETYLKAMVIDKRKAHVFISNLFIFIQNLHPIYEYIWIVVVRTIATLIVQTEPC